jgi:hypothetical protein
MFKTKFPEVHLLTDLDLVTWDLSHTKIKYLKSTWANWFVMVQKLLKV